MDQPLTAEDAWGSGYVAVRDFRQKMIYLFTIYDGLRLGGQKSPNRTKILADQIIPSGNSGTDNRTTFVKNRDRRLRLLKIEPIPTLAKNDYRNRLYRKNGHELFHATKLKGLINERRDVNDQLLSGVNTQKLAWLFGVDFRGDSRSKDSLALAIMANTLGSEQCAACRCERIAGSDGAPCNPDLRALEYSCSREELRYTPVSAKALARIATCFGFCMDTTAHESARFHPEDWAKNRDDIVTKEQADVWERFARSTGETVEIPHVAGRSPLYGDGVDAFVTAHLTMVQGDGGRSIERNEARPLGNPGAARKPPSDRGQRTELKFVRMDGHENGFDVALSLERDSPTKQTVRISHLRAAPPPVAVEGQGYLHYAVQSVHVRLKPDIALQDSLSIPSKTDGLLDWLPVKYHISPTPSEPSVMFSGKDEHLLTRTSLFGDNRMFDVISIDGEAVPEAQLVVEVLVRNCDIWRIESAELGEMPEGATMALSRELLASERFLDLLIELDADPQAQVRQGALRLVRRMRYSYAKTSQP